MASFGTAGRKLDLLIKQGSTFTMPFAVLNEDGTPKDLTGFTVRAQIRRTVKSTSATKTFAALVDPVPSSGRFVLTLSATETAGITAGDSPASPDSRFVWDLEMEGPGGVVLPLAYGAAVIHPEVTR